jgi:hypothetical protein
MKILFLFLIVSFLSNAQVNFNDLLLVENVRLYKDKIKKNVVYYGPEGMEIAKNINGQSDFNFIMIRYTGSKISGDQKTTKFKNICQFKVQLKEISTEKLNTIRQQIFPNTLQKLPLKAFKPFLIFTPIKQNESTKIIDNELFIQENILYNEEYLTIELSNLDAQILEESLLKNQTLISVGYTIWAEGNNDNKSVDLQLYGPIKSQYNEKIKNYTDSLSHKVQLKNTIIMAGVTEVILPNEHSKYIRKLDLNEQMPPQFANIEVRCYDFYNKIRTDIYAKKIQIQAYGIDNTLIQIEDTFYQKNPEEAVKYLNFEFAINNSKPLMYRIIEINKSGNQFVKGWIKKLDWSQIDITNQ